MAAGMKFDDRVWQNVTAPGPSNFNFTGATTQTGAISFDTFMTTTGDYTVYKADNGSAWETGILTKQGDGTYARTVKRSTNSNNAVNFSSGLVAVVCDLPAWLIDNLNFLEESVASAATCSIGAVQTAAVNITGTTTITSFGTGTNKLRIVRFAGALTLTHNATSLILPSGANITTVAGDTAIFTSDSSSNWRCRSYMRADGTSVGGASYKVGSFTRDTSLATGTQAITGVGFKPKAVLLFAGVTSSSRASWGFSDASLTRAIADFNPLGAGQYQMFTAIRLITNGTDIYDGQVQSFDSDGFTISWTKSGTPTGTADIYYLALR